MKQEEVLDLKPKWERVSRRKDLRSIAIENALKSFLERELTHADKKH